METETTRAVDKTELDYFFEAECFSKNRSDSVNIADVDIKQKIANVCNSVRVPLATNILPMWEWKQSDEPELFKVAQVILSLPATQVTIGRIVDAQKLMTTQLNERLADETIANIMITKLNIESLDSIGFI
jgi:hypothetical protein